MEIKEFGKLTIKEVNGELNVELHGFHITGMKEALDLNNKASRILFVQELLLLTMARYREQNAD